VSLMHRALDRPAMPGQSRRSGYNPLQRSSRRSQTIWWLIAAAAVLVALAVLGWPRWRPATDTRLPAMSQTQVQTQPDTASLSPEPAAMPSPAEPPVSEPEPASRADAPLAEPELALADVELTEPSTSQPERQPATPPASNAPTEDSPVAVETTEAAPSVAEPGDVSRPQSAKSATTPPTPEPEPTASVTTEALPVEADTGGNRDSITRDVASRAVTANSSVSSVAVAVPQDADVRQAVQAAIGQGDLAGAQRMLQSWINREPRLEEPRIWLAKVYLNQGVLEDAESLLIGLKSAEALGLRGLILEQTGRYADAARVFEALTREEAGNPQWWLHWAINLENSGRLAEARLLYQTYLEQFSGHNARLTAFATERYRALAG